MLDKTDLHPDSLAKLERLEPEFRNRAELGEYCHSGRDGDCCSPLCPQLRDKEPEKSGRHCPLDWRSPDDDYFGC